MPPKRSKSNGTGYAGDSRGDQARRMKLQKKVLAQEKQTVQVQEAKLRSGVTALTPGRGPDGELMNILKSVIRNQADWSSDRCQLYAAALDCFDRITKYHPRQLGKDDDDESLLFAFLEMTSTADIIIKHTQGYANSVVATATRVLEMKDRAVLASRLVVEKADLEIVDNHSHYRHSLRPFAFDFVDSLPAHHFARNRNTCSTMASRQRILKELGTYKTALPVEYGSSIFVRVMESRMDLLRAMIIGPDDTPYSCGCFFFDIYLDDYPTKAPKVHFLTTGGGRYRFNPNLYQDGKVCLSLLGTWQGPGWQKGESTLLQVLVSIQSLILVDQPYFNEPGYQHELGTPQGTIKSDKYNKNIRQYTMDAAMLPHFRYLAGACVYPEFNEVIEKHFTLKEHKWKKTILAWRREDQNQNAVAPQSYSGSGPQSLQLNTNTEGIYLKCVSAWESRPKNQKPRKRARSHRCESSTEITNAVEVNGVIEIDIDTPDLNSGTTSGIQHSEDSNVTHAVARGSPQGQTCNNVASNNDVIDLT